ncbi:response regulator transcription factor [Indioceanicola profundi]|uniref:response regulator transcription factor n=1 Tax=Indioceanicola profundi TaxID=2220096 RepID=UPI0013C418D2|nr:response regulator [Indioceanicola profundi]
MTRILIIDDDPSLLATLAHAVRHSGHEVRLAGSGEEGLALYGQMQPDVVLCDLLLPDLDGAEVIRSIRQCSRTVRIFAMTGCRSLEVAPGMAAALHAGVQKLLVKPFSLAELEF